MKKILSLMILLPLVACATEHSGKPMQTNTPAQQASEHGGKAMEMKGQAAEDAGAAAEHAGQPVKKSTSEHAGTPVK